jgi:signal transduction histidine kinase
MPPVLGVWQRLQLHVVAWGVVGAMLTLLVHAVLGTAWLAAAAFAVPLALIAAPISLSAWYLCSALPLSRASALRVGVSLGGAAIVTAAMWAAIGQGWWRLLATLGLPLGTAPAWALASVLIGLGALAYLLSVAVNYLLIAFEDAADAEQRVLRSEIAAREAELRALRAQIDPHFLFNSLNSIAGLIAVDPGRARAMGQLLADFLRESLTLGGAARISLAREVGLAQRYLEIEQVRFGRRLEVVATVAADAAAVPVPPLLLQPLVENAVRHGIATCLEGGRVDITATRAGDMAVVVITNPRDPEDGSGRRGTGFGLDIVRRRLAASFGDAAALAIQPATGSYRVTVTIPVEQIVHT